MIKKISHYIGWNLRMPWWLFWACLLSFTWFYVVRRTISWDLWWHMAAGRYMEDHGFWAYLFNPKTWLLGGAYLREHGVYPDNSVFTFSPVTDTAFTSRTWLGDIIFHKTYDYGGFYGLQILRASFILSSVFFMLHLARWRHNIWTLVAAGMMIIGTMQKHLTKNAIVVIPVMSFITWVWIQARYNGKVKWLWSLPFVFLIWVHFHGSALVGVYFILLIAAGEAIDSILLPLLGRATWKNIQWLCSDMRVVLMSIAAVIVLWFLPWYLSIFLIVLMLASASFQQFLRPFFDNVEKKRSNVTFLLVLCCSVFLSFVPVATVWGMPWGTIQSIAGKIIPSLKSKQEVLNDQDKALANNNKTQAPKDVKSKLKNMFRVLFGGTDADLVAEYQWPFDILYVLSVKAVFLLVIFYFIYFLMRVTVGWQHLAFSMELPSIALLYISMGYLRTVSYPFIVVLPLMAYAMSQGFGSTKPQSRKIVGIILLALNAILLILHLGSDIFSEFNNLFFNALGYAQYLAVPFMFVPLILGLLFLIHDDRKFKLSIGVLSLSLGLWTTACLVKFTYFENTTYQQGDFHSVSGFLDTEPGLGKSNKFFDGMADYVTAKLPPEKNIYNSYNMGGYLQWKWYGKRKVFIDGRSAIFDNTFYQAYTQNNAVEYIQKNDFDHAIISMLVDKDRLLYFLQQGWSPIAFDSVMTVLQRPKSKIEDIFGVLPEYIEGERTIGELENLDRQALGNFINSTLHHMMLFGRIKDGKDFMTQAMPIIEQLKNEELINQLKGRKEHVERIAAYFGDVNHRALGPLCQKLFKNIQGVELSIAMGEACYALQLWDKAEMEYSKAYQAKKDDKNILMRLGEVLYMQKKNDRALMAYQEALKIDPNDPRIHNAALLSLLATNQIDKAIMAGQTAIRLNPNMPDAQFNLGVAYQQNGDIASAKKCFEEVLRINPNMKPAQEMLHKLQTPQENQP